MDSGYVLQGGRTDRIQGRARIRLQGSRTAGLEIKFFSFIFMYVHAAITFYETSNVISSLKTYAGYTLNRINPMFPSNLDINESTYYTLIHTQLFKNRRAIY